jgi:transposase InsO family protein
VRHVQKRLDVSERRACGVIGQARSSQRYRPQERSGERGLVAKMLELVRGHPRYGYRRVWALLRAEGFRVNRKRVHRLWKRQGLKVPVIQHKKRRLGTSDNGIARHRALHKDHVWAWDFIHDRTEDGRTLKWLSVVDEFTRECLALEVRRSFRSGDVIDVLRELLAIRGAPLHIRSDNGPEFMARAIGSWLESARVGTLYIEPGSPWENGYAESLHGRLRDELLDAELFGCLAEAKLLSTQWRLEYNHRRPHSSLGYRTPAAFAASLAESPVGAAPLPAPRPAKREVILS